MKSIASGRAAGVNEICSTSSSTTSSTSISSSTPIPSSSAPSPSSSVASLYGGQAEGCSEEENGAGISRWLEVWEPRVDALCASVSMMVKGERSQRERRAKWEEAIREQALLVAASLERQ